MLWVGSAQNNWYYGVNFIGDHYCRNSTSGHVFFGGRAVSWSSQKHDVYLDKSWRQIMLLEV